MHAFYKSKLKSHLIALVMLIIALLLITIGQIESTTEILKINFGTILSNFGSFIGFIAVSQWLYDQFVRQNFFEEIATTIVNCQSIQSSGIVEFFPDSKRIDITSYISTSKEMLVTTLYSNRIIEANIDNLRKRVVSGKKLIILSLAINKLTAQYLDSINWIKLNKLKIHDEDINQTVQELNSIKKNTVTRKHFDTIPKYTALMFDHDIIIIFNTNSQGKKTTPALRIHAGSELFDFFKKDLEEFSKQAT